VSDGFEQIIAFSGGKDSTALTLRMAELGEAFKLLFTPTGNELPECIEHVKRIVALTGAELILPPNHSLDYHINEFNALPSFHSRWCTRLIKIEPCISYLLGHPATLCVGLRADELSRGGIYGDFLFLRQRYPLQEWGWGLKEVLGYLKDCGVEVPARTDCALCYDQRLSEWYALWRDHPEEFAKGEAYESRIGHTFRSAQRDTWPASLAGLRAEFESGRIPRGVENSTVGRCRVCTL
jgi:hypothetical protein